MVIEQMKGNWFSEHFNSPPRDLTCILLTFENCQFCTKNAIYLRMVAYHCTSGNFVVVSNHLTINNIEPIIDNCIYVDKSSCANSATREFCILITSTGKNCVLILSKVLGC